MDSSNSIEGDSIEDIPPEKRKNVYALSTAAFFNDTGSDMLTPAYSTFLTVVLGTPQWIIGLIDSISRLFGAIIRPISGRIGDLKGRKPFIWIGYLALMISRGTQALAVMWAHLIAPKVLYELGRGVRNPAREALIAGDVGPKRRGWAFGLLQTADSLGAILGPTIGYFIWYLLIDYFGKSVGWTSRALLLIAAAPTIFSVLVVIIFVKERRKKKQNGEPAKEKAGEEEILKTNIEEVEKNASEPAKGNNHSTEIFFDKRAFIYITIVVALLALAIPTENLMLTMVQERYTYTGDLMFVLFFFFNVFYALIALPAGLLTDKIGGRIVFILSAALLVLFGVLSAVNFGGSLFFTIPTLVVFGLFHGSIYPPMMKLVARSVPEARRAELMGMFSMFKTAAEIGSPFLLGVLFSKVSAYTPYIFIGALALIAIVMMIFAPKGLKKKIEK